MQLTIHLLLMRRDKGHRPGHHVEAAHLHRRLHLVYSELGGYLFRDASGVYYDGPALYEVARWLSPTL